MGMLILYIRRISFSSSGPWEVWIYLVGQEKLVYLDWEKYGLFTLSHIFAISLGMFHFYTFVCLCPTEYIILILSLMSSVGTYYVTFLLRKVEAKTGLPR